MLSLLAAVLMSASARAPLVRTQPGAIVIAPQAFTNYVLNSGSTCKAGNTVDRSWTLVGSPTCANDAAIDPTGASSMDTWTSAANTDRVFQTIVTPSSSVFAGSVWAAKVSGTGAVTVIVRCGPADNATACACYTSDGSASSSAIATTDCTCKFTAIGTSTVRVQTVAACTSPSTGPSIFLNPGNYGVATGSAHFQGVQLEARPYASRYIPTETAAVTQRR